jgi:hypothetical protein
VAVFIFISNGRFGGDGLENYLTAESIVLDGNFSTHDRTFGIKEMSYEERGHLGPHGETVSGYGLGMAFLLVPFYFLGHIISGLFHKIPHDYITQFCVSLTNPLILALLALALFKLLMQLGFSLRQSFYSVFIYSLCSMNLIYVRSGFAEPTVALLVILASLSMFRFEKNGELIQLVLSGFCIGYAMFIKKNSCILFPAFLIYLTSILCFLSNKKVIFLSLLAFLFPISLAVLATVVQNKFLYGGVTRTEFGTMHEMFQKIRTDGHPIKGLYHYLISPGKGYLFYNISLVLGLFAIKDFFKKYRLFCIFVIILLISNLGYYCFTFVRDSLFSWGPRYLFPTLPLFTVFLAEFISKNNFLKRRLAIIIFALLGFLIQFPSALINSSKYLFFVRDNLKLPEYLIYYVPDLSPIKGSWTVLLSSLNRHLHNESLYFIFNPDFRFIQQIKVSLFNYDMIDIWWVNVIKVNFSLLGYVVVIVLAILMLVMFSFWKIHFHLRNHAE